MQSLDRIKKIVSRMLIREYVLESTSPKPVALFHSRLDCLLAIGADRNDRYLQPNEFSDAINVTPGRGR